MFTGSLGPKEFSIRYVKKWYVNLILICYVKKVASKTVVVVVIFENWQAEMPIFKQKDREEEKQQKLLDQSQDH